MSKYNRGEGRRRRRPGRAGKRRYQEFRGRRSRGWGMGLYRNRTDGKICGVAAGLADYWDVADWAVRLMFVGAFLFTGSLAIWAYVAGYVLLSPRPAEGEIRRRDREAADQAFAEKAANSDDGYGPEMEYDERSHDYRPRRLFHYSDSASVRLARARERLDEALRRVEDMETYVTSRRFKLNREFSRL
ncbi:MAG: phage shock protein C [Halieaceae bacterium]|jgi:phage shock protein C